MKTPKFWKNNNIISTLLSPLGWIYSNVTKHKIKYGKFPKLNIPVICIGNLTAGGTGKTPVCISICKILQKADYNPCFITRGYGGKAKDLYIKKGELINPVIAGDEPLLLSQIANVSINANRYQAGLKAIENGADILILDDGFQNPTLYKDKSLIVVDGEYGFGNKKAIPAGPLRENISEGLKRAHAIIVVGEDKHKIKELADKYKLKYFNGFVKPIKPKIKNKNIIAFAGIGRPEKLYNSLKNLGYVIKHNFSFADHHFYTNNEIENIINLSQKENLEVFTTSKDFTKIPEQYRKSINVLDIKIDWKNENKLKEFLKF
jgi:tetraacyldisaccharide 4'-kinase